MLTALLFLRLVSEACQTSMSAWALDATGWLVQAAILLKIFTWLIDDIAHGFSCILWHSECNTALIYAISPWKLLNVAITCHFVATHHSYISACGVHKNYQKWYEIQLAVQSVVGSLIAITSYRFVANFKLAALIKPSLNITLWISELCIFKYLSLCVNGRFFHIQ